MDTKLRRILSAFEAADRAAQRNLQGMYELTGTKRTVDVVGIPTLEAQTG